MCRVLSPLRCKAYTGSAAESYKDCPASYGSRGSRIWRKIPVDWRATEMKRFALCMAGVIAVSINVLAQRGAPAPPQPLEPGASQAEVDKALVAAPANLKNGAMVIKWAPDRQSYTTLRKANEGN